MRLDVVPETIAERIARRLNLAPTPLAHTHLALLLARAVMEASRAGVFEALADGPMVPQDVAARCQLDLTATSKLLGALATSGYLAYHGRHDTFALTPMARMWLLPSSTVSVHDKILFTFHEDTLIQRMGDYLRSGTTVSSGGHLAAPGDREFWTLYQRGMRAVASVAAAEVARRTPVPAGATRMLDIGGSHGLFSVALCRRHPGLSSTVLDLAEAVEQAAPLLAAEGMGTRVTHQVGNVLETDLGDAQYDVVFLSNLVHHFDEHTNQALMRQIGRALRPRGTVTVQDMMRRDSPTAGGQTGALLDLYFALTSESGTWSLSEIAGWQRDAGLVTRRPVQLRTLPGAAQQSAVRAER